MYDVHKISQHNKLAHKSTDKVI